MKPRILVTAAGGKTGFPTALQLLARGHPVRAFVRRPSARSRVLSEVGAEVVVGDLMDATDLAAALRGMNRAYFCPPWHPHLLSAGVGFATAVQDARLESVVLLSQWLADADHPSFATRQTWHLERLFALLPGTAVTVVNPGWFADNYMQVLGMIAQLGVMPLPLGDGQNAPPSNEDIARVVVGALLAPDRHAGQCYRPTGPQLLAPEQIAAVFARVLRRPVRYLDIPDWMMTRALQAVGLPVFQQAQVRHYVHDYRRNAFGLGAPTAAVREVGGSEPEDFEAITRRYVATRPEATRSAGNWARAVATFVRIPFTSVPDFARLEQRMEQPPPARPCLAADSTAWLAKNQLPAQP